MTEVQPEVTAEGEQPSRSRHRGDATGPWPIGDAAAAPEPTPPSG